MKKQLILFALSALVLLFAGYGCSDDDYLSDREIQQMIDESLNGQWQVIAVDVPSGDWQFFQDEFETYYHATVNLPELTDYIFTDGASLAYYYFNANSKTVLPYVKTIVGEDGIPFTETYSCDFTLGNPSTATFYLEASDAGFYEGNPPAADFDIVLIY